MDDVRQIAEDQTGLNQKIEEVRTDLETKMGENFSILSEAIAKTQEDITDIKQDVSTLKQDVREIRQELSHTREELRGGIQTLREEFHAHTHTSP